MGGWLLFYFWQRYSGAVLTTIVFIGSIHNYVPEAFDSSQYYWLLASTIPQFLILSLEVAVGTMLVAVRTWDLLRLQRWLIVAGFAAGVIGFAIDLNYFPDAAALDLLTVIPAFLWIGYFFRSRRVVHVFKTHDWDSAVNAIYPLKVLR